MNSWRIQLFAEKHKKKKKKTDEFIDKGLHKWID